MSGEAAASKKARRYDSPIRARRAQETRAALMAAAAELFTTSTGPCVLRWDSIGPPAADKAWDHYRHASGVSVSWTMTNILGSVHAEGLAPLLRPHPAIARKRVSLIYEIRDAGKSPGVAAADVRAAEARAAAKRKPSAADRKDIASAIQTADEEAHGAGLVDVSAVVTATVLDPADIADAVAAVDSLGPAARLQLRRSDGQLGVGLAQGLPVGLVTAAHLVMPRQLRESL